MRIKRIPNFQTEVIYRESPDKKDRIRQLWDLLISLPDPEPVSSTSVSDKNKNKYENQKITTNI